MDAALAVGFGVVIGLLLGLVGGGFLIVPVLVLVSGLPMRLAVGTSLIVTAINSGAGILAHLRSGGIEVALALLFVAGGFAGATLGGRLLGRVDETRLSRGFAALVALVGVYLVARNGAALM